jgi:hypothetical protein
MRLSRNIFLIAAIAILCSLLSGCFLLMLAGFGYTGYQYHEKEGVFAPGQVFGGPAPDDADKDKKSSDSASKPPPVNNNDIE